MESVGKGKRSRLYFASPDDMLRMFSTRAAAAGDSAAFLRQAR